MGGQSLESFRVVKRIAVGGFGVVDEGVGPNGELVAIKKELTSDKITRPILEHEYHVYQALAGHFCIPDVKAYGRLQRHNVMVVELLGPSLGDRFRQCGRQFSLGTTVHLALGMLDAIEYIHSQGFINRDIKPENFLLGLGTKSHVVHLIDFGIARRWELSTIATHVSSSAAEGGAGVIGTLKFASVYAHLGQAQTRRDDLHSLVYTILSFARGSLPWDHIRRGTQTHCARRTLEKKRSWTAERLCQGLPHELEMFSRYCLDLEISDEPDYRLLRDTLAVIADREGCGAGIKFEWDEPGWTVSVEPEPAPAPSAKRMPAPCIKRGDILFLKLVLEKSLDYESPPRPFDSSFFPHQNISGMDWQPPNRPAVVRRIFPEKDDATYFNLEVFPLTRRSGLNGLSTRRSRNFVPLETIIETATGIRVPCDDIFVYRTSLLTAVKIEYDQPKPSLSRLSVPECTVASIEAVLTNILNPYAIVYDSDDEETRTIEQSLPVIWYPKNYVAEVRLCGVADLSGEAAVDFSDMHGWLPEMIRLEKVRSMEDGGSSDDDSDVDTVFWEWPRPLDRRLSCTVNVHTSKTDK